MTPEAMRQITEGTREALRYSLNEGAEETFRREQECNERIRSYQLSREEIIRRKRLENREAKK